MKLKRGRPRQFDTAQVLQSVMEVFWVKGFSATSLDDLASATGLTRPSLYNAFGSKMAIYQLALNHFVSKMREVTEATLFGESNPESAFLQFFHQALQIYAKDGKQLGCFVSCTTACEAGTSEELRRVMYQVITEADAVFERRLLKDQGLGMRGTETGIREAAMLLHATLQSCAIRVRAGADESEVKAMYTAMIRLLCGT